MGAKRQERDGMVDIYLQEEELSGLCYSEPAWLSVETPGPQHNCLFPICPGKWFWLSSGVPQAEPSDFVSRNTKATANHGRDSRGTSRDMLTELATSR